MLTGPHHLQDPRDASAAAAVAHLQAALTSSPDQLAAEMSGPVYRAWRAAREVRDRGRARPLHLAIAEADRDGQTVADLLTSLRSLSAVGDGWNVLVSVLSRGHYTTSMQEAVACLAACQARLRFALTTRATSEAEARLGATSGDVLESEEFTMLDTVCVLLDVLVSSGTMRGRAASGLIEMVPAFTCPPHPGQCALLR